MRISRLFSVIVLFIFFAGCHTATKQTTIPTKNDYFVIPKPAKLIEKSGFFQINAKTSISTASNDKQMKNMASMLSEAIGATLTSGKASNINLSINPAITNKEGYHLTISDKGISIVGQQPQGVFYGIQTLLQLLQTAPTKGFPYVEIDDAPSFEYRGMHLDVSRHMFPVDFIKKYINLLAQFKMNRFHWHLTDDQGWRIEIKKYPKLQEIAAFRDQTLIGHAREKPEKYDGKRYGGYYTQEEVKDIIRYAQERFVTIVPEIELPGHSVAVLAAYPELGCEKKEYKTLQKWGISEDIFCPTEATFQFFENVLTEVMTLFPGEYIHIGGDEAPKTKWEQSDFCQKLIKKEHLKDEHGLQSYFIQRIEKFVNSKGKKIIGWDEILEGGLAPNAAVMSWRGEKGGIEAARQHHKVVMTPTTYCYFDYYQAQNDNEPQAIGGYLPLSKVYSFYPIPDDLNKEEAAYIMGGQANIWTEYMETPAYVEYMAYPRALALAEKVWTPKADCHYSDFIRRLTSNIDRLKKQGVNVANHLFDIKAKVSNSENNIEMKLFTENPDAKIYYTDNGTKPTTNSHLYTAPLVIKTSKTIKVQAFRNGQEIGNGIIKKFNIHKAAGKKISLKNAPVKKYSSGGITAVINGVLGSDKRYGDDDWLGFEGEDFEAVIDFGKEETVNKAVFRFFQSKIQWIYLPKSLEVAISNDGKTYTKIGDYKNISGKGNTVEITAKLKESKGRYLKVIVHRFGNIPKGAQGAGNEAWLFVDEVIIR